MASPFDEITGLFRPDPALLEAYAGAEETMRYVNADESLRERLKQHLLENADITNFDYSDPELKWVLEEYLNEGEQEQYLKDVLSDVLEDIDASTES